MTPEEEKKQINKDFWIYIGVFVLITALGLLLAAAVGYLVPVDSGIPRSGTQASAYMVRIFQFVMIIIVLGLAGWLSDRVRKKLLQKKLGRHVFGEHELTSLTSWMEAARRDEEGAKEATKRLYRESGRESSKEKFR